MDQTIELVEILCTPQIGGVEQNQPVNVINGGDNRGTYVIKDLVYDYTMWINPRFRSLVIRTFDAVVTQSRKIVEASTWEQQRQAGKEVRANFTTALENHGVSGFGFAQCTNGIYRPLQRIDANADHGNSPCYKTCKSSGEAVSDLLIKKLN